MAAPNAALHRQRLFVFAPAGGTLVYDRFGASTLWYAIGALGVLLWAGALALRGPLHSSTR